MSVEFLPDVAPAQDPSEQVADASQASGRPRRPQSPWLHSLASRLVCGVVALVVLLVLATGSSTYYVLRSFLYHRLDQQLAATSRPGSILPVLSPSSRFGIGLAVPQTVFVVIVDNGTGQAIPDQPAGQDITALKLPASTLKQLAGRDTGSASVRTLDGQQVRIRSVTGFATDDPVTGTPEPATVVIGLSEADLQRTLGRTIDAELVIGGCAVLVALLATAIGVQLSLRRLKRVTATAQDVAHDLSPDGAGLDRRVPEGDNATEVGQLAQSFNTMLAAVEMQFAARVESERRMRQFLADASHELRTPLTSIRGYAELARMQRAASNGTGNGAGGAAAGHDDGDNLDRIESEGTRMSRLVDDLLLLARGDDGTNAARADDPVDVADVLEDVVETSRVAHPDRPIDIAVSELPAVLGDRDQLLRAVRNLVTNAAVHTAPGRAILVSAGTDDRAGRHEVVVQVADGGPGLPPEEAAHVFERFWRADKARTRARGGTGLGMSIVDAIVRSHGGTVRFDSDVDRGSTVTIRLPAAPMLVGG